MIVEDQLTFLESSCYTQVVEDTYTLFVSVEKKYFKKYNIDVGTLEDLGNKIKNLNTNMQNQL